MLSRRANLIFFYIVPFLIATLFFSVENFSDLEAKRKFYSEFGIELAQEALLFVCLGLSLWLLAKLNNAESRWLKIWSGIAALVCFYIFIEEISWGQKFFQWQTPAGWAEGVTQKETNIHNHSQLFNRVPRAILEIGILVAGLVIPGLMKWMPQKLPEKFAAIYPFSKIALAGILTLIVKLLESFPSLFDIQVFYRKSEVMETFMYYFIFLYLLSLAQKWTFEGRLKP